MVKTVLDVEGMSCGMCEAHINDTVRRDFDVKKVVSSRKKGKVEIISAEPLDLERLQAAVRNLGYSVNAVKADSYEKKRLFGK